MSGVVCVVDVTTIKETIERHFECMKQLAFADRIVLTKTDIAPTTTADSASRRQQILEINPGACIIDRHEAGFDLAGLFAPRHYSPSEQGSDVEALVGFGTGFGTTGFRSQRQVA